MALKQWHKTVEIAAKDMKVDETIKTPTVMRKISLTACRMAFFSMDCIILTWPASMQIYWNKRKRLHKKRVQLPHDWFGTQHGRSFIVLGHQYGQHDIMWKESIQNMTAFEIQTRDIPLPFPNKALSMIFCCRTLNCSQTKIIQTLRGP